MPDIARFNNDKIYSNGLITKKIEIPLKFIGSNIKDVIEKKIAKQIEGKCCIEGYIKPNSVKVITYSSGLVQQERILFEVTFECLICLPVENMLVKCIAKNITKAGIRAELDETPSPLIIFIARDHHYKNPEYFSSISENDSILIKIIGQRYELNDSAISVIAELVDSDKKQKKKIKKQPRLIIEN